MGSQTLIEGTRKRENCLYTVKHGIEFTTTLATKQEGREPRAETVATQMPHLLQLSNFHFKLLISAEFLSAAIHLDDSSDSGNAFSK